MKIFGTTTGIDASGENESAKFWLNILNDLKNESFMIAS